MPNLNWPFSCRSHSVEYFDMGTARDTMRILVSNKQQVCLFVAPSKNLEPISPGLFREPITDLTSRFSAAEEARPHLFGFPRHSPRGRSLGCGRAGAIQREHDAGCHWSPRAQRREPAKAMGTVLPIFNGTRAHSRNVERTFCHNLRNPPWPTFRRSDTPPAVWLGP